MASVMTISGMVMLGQAVGDGATADSSAASVQSVWDFVTKGGLMMIPIGICSLIALTILVERALSLRRRKVIPAGFLAGVRKSLNGGDDREGAMEYCKKDGSPIALIVAAGIKKLGQSSEIIEKSMQGAGERAVLMLRRYTRALAVIASVSPLLGLLGTIIGMIHAFQTVAMSPEALGRAELLARGIYVAMITTAAGLMVAIPALIGYHWVSAKIEGLVSEMDHVAMEFIDEFGGYRPEASDRVPKLRAAGSDSADVRDSEQDDEEPIEAVASA